MNHSELAHKWAHAGPDASRRCGSMSFQGDTLYSYGTPIARIYRKKARPSVGESAGGLLNATVREAHRGKTLVLVAEHSYSVSTAKHISHAFRAVSHLDALRVPRYIIGAGRMGRYAGSGIAAEDHAANLAFFKECMDRAAARAMRVYNETRVQWEADNAARAHKAMADYMIFFGIRRKMPAMPGFAAAFERARRIENPDPESKDKRERGRAKRAERNRERDEYLAEQRRSVQRAKLAREFYRIGAARASFRLGDAWGNDYEALRSSACLLRVHGDDIETSYGAKVPLAAAPMVWNLVQNCRRNGFTGAPRGAGKVKIGDYPLDRIDADGTLHAGCHIIPFSELAMMARALGLEVQS